MKKQFVVRCQASGVETGKHRVRAFARAIGCVSGALCVFLYATNTEAQYTADFQTNTISAVISNWVGNGTYVVGSNNVNDALIIQNGGVLSNGTGYVGFESIANNNGALVTGTGSVWKNNGDLIIGPNGSFGNTLTLTNGGAVTVTGTLQVASGTLSINGGQATVGQLVYTSGLISEFSFTAGTLNTGGTFETNGVFAVVGDGVNLATMNLQGGLHSFADALCISSNAILTGSGAVDGLITNVNPTGTGGQVIADGTTLTFLAPAGVAAINLTNPTISTVVITNGGAVVFCGLDTAANAWNLASTVLLAGGAGGGSLISSNGGTGRSLILRSPSFRSTGNNGTLAVVGGAGFNYTLIGGVLTNNFVITGVGSFTGNFGNNNFGVYNRGTISTVAGSLLTFDPRDAATLAGFQNDTNGTIVIANGGTLSLRRTTNAWWRPLFVSPFRFNTNSGTILMQGGTFHGSTDQGPGPTNLTVAGRIYNTGLIQGCGTIENFNSFVNNGTILADCGTFTMNLTNATLTFTNSVSGGITNFPVSIAVFTNNGTWKATDGSVLESTALVVNNGTIDITGGTTNFLGGFVNNGTVISGGCSNSLASIKLLQKVGSDMQLSFTTPCTVVYTVETNGNLVTSSWTTLATTNGNGTNGVITITDTGGALATNRFYRVRSP